MSKMGLLLQTVKRASLRKHPFLLALRRWRRFARNVPTGEERGETDVFAGYKRAGLYANLHEKVSAQPGP